MAHFHPMILIVLLISLVSHAASTTYVINDDYSIFVVDTICKRTKDYDSCTKALNSDPRTPTADLPIFAQIALDLTSRSASSTSQYIADLVAKNPADKKDFDVCVKDYRDAASHIAKAYKLLKSKSYGAVKKVAEAVGNDGVGCEDSWKGKTSPLTSRNKALELLASIVAVVADLVH
ncbi:hypothetical protein ACLOJK_026311 [Asimina triloba]